jgi:transposase
MGLPVRRYPVRRSVSQIRNLDSEGRAYYDRKVADGKTRREAMRALKRHISDRVYRRLLADANNK